MPVTGLNHVTLTVADLDRSVAFYGGLLGGRLRARWPEGAYLELGGLWLCLMSGDPAPGNDYSHIALDCDAADFASLATRISQGARRWQDNSSEGQSLYFLDPDGHRLELHVGTLASRLAHYAAQPEKKVTIYAD